MERTVLIPMAALLVQAITQASPSPQLTEADAATASLRTTAANPGSYERRLGASGFEENKGQVKQTDGQPAPYVKFRLNDGGTNIFLLERGIAYQFNRMHDPEGYAELAHRGHLSSEDEARLDDLRKQRRLETYRMDMTLEGADPHAPITTEGRSADFTNYYLSGVEALDVRTFSKVVYHGVYPGIDWEVTTTEMGFEQDFIVHPGADPSLVKMRFKGHEELFVDGQGQLIHGNRLGRFVEAGPTSFQSSSMVRTAFVLQDDVLTFALGGYDNTRTLRIDPTREWGTYYGGAADDWGKDLACDGDGNVYMAGYTASAGANVIATTTGVFDSSYNLGQDGFLVKFDSNGNRLWGTYYGGSNDDFLVSCAVRGNEVVAAGTSESPDLGTSGTQQPAFAFSAEGDAILVNFNAEDGSRNWATYYGGLKGDAGNSCAFDPWGYIYMAGKTSAMPGGQDTIAFDGFQMELQEEPDFFLAKFDSVGRRKWGTYYGGYSDDPFSYPDVATDLFGNVVLVAHCGYNSNDGATFVSPGAHHEAHGTSVFPGTGGDAFVAKFDSSGERLWGTYYGGANNETCWTCAIDLEGNIYVAGETKSDTGIWRAGHKQFLATEAGLQDDVYLAKFSPSGELEWGTYYGDTLKDEIRASFTNVQGYVYVSGNTSSTNGISLDGYQMTHGGGDADALMIGFRSDGGLVTGSYYGGSADDNILGAAPGPDGSMYVCGWTRSSNDTTICSSSGFDISLSSTQDAFMAKFRTDCLGHAAGNQEQGTPCVDPDPCTINDVYNASCVCEGEYPDAGQIVGNSVLGSGIQYTFTVFPAIPNAEYTWVVPPGWTALDIHSDTLIVTAPAGADVGDIGVWGTNGDCLLDTATVSVLVQNVVGITERGAEEYFSIQPNPNNGQFIVVRNAHLPGLVDYELLDATGRRKQTNGTFNGQRVDIDMSEASSGVYFLRLRHAAGTGVLRLVVQH